MPRPLRENLAGGIYHVFARGNNREPIFYDDVDRRLYLRRLEKTVVKLEWRGLAYCLMDNHVHLLIETPEPNLSEGMRILHGQYAQVLNLRHDRVGHVFQGRYGAVRMTNDAQVCVTAAYIARNPVAAGLCRAPAEWKWSSFRGVADGNSPQWVDGARLVQFFAETAVKGRELYVELSNAEVDKPKEGLTPFRGEGRGIPSGRGRGPLLGAGGRG